MTDYNSDRFNHFLSYLYSLGKILGILEGKEFSFFLLLAHLGKNK